MADTAIPTRTTSVERLDEGDRFDVEGRTWTVVENLGEVDENDEHRGIVTIIARADGRVDVDSLRIVHGPIDVHR